MDQILLAAPRFAIPKKKKKLEELEVAEPDVEPDSRPNWQNILPNTAQFSQLEAIVRQHQFDSNLRLAIYKAELLDNPWLTYRFEKYRKALKANEQHMAFLLISQSHEEIEYIGKNGLAVGGSLNDDLGTSENGVYLSSNIDLVAPQTFLIGSRTSCTVRILICKILKGRINMVGLGSKDLDPSSGYGCHMVKTTNEDARKRKRLDLYRQNLIYMYELNENLEAEPVPSGILPYAYVDLAVDGRASIDKKLRLSRFELSNSMYTGKIVLLDKPYLVNFFTTGEETWKPLGIDPIIHVRNFVKWKIAMQESPLLDLFENEMLGVLLHKKEVQLINGWFVTYFILQPQNASMPFTTLVETLATNHLMCICGSVDNVQLLIPPGELANRLGLPPHIESAFHLIVSQSRSFYGSHQDTMKQIMVAGRHPSNTEIVQGFNRQLDDYISEEFEQHINNGSGINSCYAFENSQNLRTTVMENPPSATSELGHEKCKFSEDAMDIENASIENSPNNDAENKGKSSYHPRGDVPRTSTSTIEPRREEPSLEATQLITDPRRCSTVSNESHQADPNEAVRNFRHLFSQALGKMQENEAELANTIPPVDQLNEQFTTGSLPLEIKKTKTRISDMPMPPAHKKDEYDPGAMDFMNEAVDIIDEDIENAPSPEAASSIDAHDDNFDLLGIQKDLPNMEPCTVTATSLLTDDEDLRINCEKEECHGSRFETVINAKKETVPENHVNALVFRTIYKENDLNEEPKDTKQTTKRLEDFLSGFSSRFVDTITKTTTNGDESKAAEHLNSPPPPSSPSYDEQSSQAKSIPLEGEAYVSMDTDLRGSYVSNKDVDLRIGLPNAATFKQPEETSRKLMWPPLSKNQEMVYKQGILRAISEGLQINPGVRHSSQIQRPLTEVNKVSKIRLLPTPNIPMNPVSTHLVSNTDFVREALRSPNAHQTFGNSRFNVKETLNVTPQSINKNHRSPFLDSQPKSSSLECNQPPLFDEGPASPDLEEGELLEENEVCEVVKAIPSTSISEISLELRGLPDQRNSISFNPPPFSHPSMNRPTPLPLISNVNLHMLSTSNEHFRPSMVHQGAMPVPLLPSLRNSQTLQRGPKVTIIIPDGMLFIAGTALTPNLLEKILLRLMALNQGADKYVMHMHYHCNKAIHDRILNAPEHSQVGQILRGLAAIIDRFAQYNVVKILAKHNCDLDNRSVDVIVSCLRQIRSAQNTASTIIFMSNASVGAVFGRRIVQDGFSLETPFDLAARLGA